LVVGEVDVLISLTHRACRREQPQRFLDHSSGIWERVDKVRSQDEQG
jgi:hypothetical protein